MRLRRSTKLQLVSDIPPRLKAHGKEDRKLELPPLHGYGSGTDKANNPLKRGS